MKKVARSWTKSILKQLNLYSLYSLKKDSFLQQAGWFISFDTQQAVDRHGEPIPWLTYPLISFLEKKLVKEMSVFEYGCGNSTLWWSKRTSYVVACEHDQQWYEKVRQQIPENVELHYVQLDYGGAYCKKVSEYKNAFDIVVIDGRDRVNCAKNALNALKVDGVIIWDNTDRDDYQEGYQFLLQNGYKRLDFQGMSPIITYESCTSIFYKDKNCFDI